MGVLGEFQKKGIAQELIKETETLAKNRGVEYVRLSVWIKNKPAYRLYKKCGYEDFSLKMVKKL